MTPSSSTKGRSGLARLTFANLSLRARLVLVFSGLLVIGLVVAWTLMMEQRRVYQAGENQEISAHDQLIRALKLREVVNSVYVKSRFAQVSPQELAEFERLAHEQILPEPLVRDFVHSVQDPGTPRGGRDPQQLIRAMIEQINSIIEQKERATISLAEDQHLARERSLHIGFFALLTFLIIGTIVGYRMIAIVTRPLTSMIRFLDELDVEDDIPAVAPRFASELPEMSRVSKSFEHFLQRIWGYRAINIRRLLIEKQRADLIASCISDGIILLKDDEIVYCNHVGERILGAKPGALRRTQRLSELVQEPAQKSSSTPIGAGGARAIFTAISRSMPVEFSLQTEERPLHYLIHSRPIVQEEPIEEITDPSLNPADHRAIEKTLERFKATTLVLAQDVTLVRESQEAKGHFLATLSHEIKTPVTSLTMATRLLHKHVEQIPNPSHRSLIATCAEDVDRLRGLLGDLLSISSFDTLTQRLEIQNVDIARLVKHSVQSFRPQAKERGVDLTCDVNLGGVKSVMIPMDPTKVAWALSNLLTNGLRHTPRGGSVAVRVEANEEGVSVHVRDSGPGIDRKRLAGIFEKFNSYYDLRVARTGSAGVGLAIAREIVVAHQGKIWVTSEPGQGAEFSFSLPIKARAREQAEEIGTSLLGAGKGVARGSSAGSG